MFQKSIQRPISFQTSLETLFFPGQREGAGFSFSLWSPRGSSRGPKCGPKGAGDLFARILRCFLHIRLKNTSVFAPRLQNLRILQCFLHGVPQKLECFCPEASKSSYFTCFLHGMLQKHECFSLQMLKMLENVCLFGFVSSKCSKMASARQKMSFLSL